jgi:hypothetical protein
LERTKSHSDIVLVPKFWITMGASMRRMFLGQNSLDKVPTFKGEDMKAGAILLCSLGILSLSKGSKDT